VTSGVITAVDITFPGLSVMDKLVSQGPVASDWNLSARASVGVQGIFLSFTTAPTPGSLVGFTSGTITGGVAIDALEDTLYTVVGGSVTAPTASPEPSSIALVLFGIAVLPLMRKRSGQGLPRAS